MKTPWFSQVGIFFIPKAIGGWLVLLLAAALAVCMFIDIDSRSHSVSDTLMNFVFRLFILGIVYSVIGFATSRGKKTAPPD